MRILFTKQFTRQFSRLNPVVKTAFKKKLELLINTYPKCPGGLRIKKLKNVKFNQHSFRVNIDYRVIYIIEKETLELLEILKHNDFDKKYS
jgi:mRNA-degrading endonuclease RelE of RelBE toxin-antitoxin system